MLLTLSAKSLWKNGRSPGLGIELSDLPRWARAELGVHGLTLQTSLFTGWDARRLDRLRDEADKASCPCLLLVEEQPQSLGAREAAKADAAEERLGRVLRVGHRLGCSGVVLSVEDPGAGALTDALSLRLKGLVGRAERLELNMLLAPAPGLTETPAQLTTLIRKVGGFRIGSYPDFQTACDSGDPTLYLRSLAPYASAVCASSVAFDSKGRHTAYDLSGCVQAVQSVGYDATLTLEYRGKGDPLAALQAAKSIIQGCFSEEPAEEDSE